MQIAIKKIDITPSAPSYLAGHAIRVAKHIDVLDPIYATVLIIEDAQLLCFVSIDVVMVDESYSNLVRQRISEKYSISIDNILVSFLHNHSGPEFTDINAFDGTSEHACLPGYKDEVLIKIMTIVDLAINNLQDVKIDHGVVNIEGYYSNRNSVELLCDKNIDIIKFHNEDEVLGLMINLSCHSTVLGSDNLLMSADLAGAIRAKLEGYYNCKAICFIGASGDTSNRQYRQGSNADELERVSEGIFQQIIDKISYLPIVLSPINVESYNYQVSYIRNRDEILKTINATKIALDNAFDVGSRQLYTSGLAFLQQKLNDDPNVEVSVKGAIIRMGDVVLVSVSAELFAKFGLAIKDTLKDKKILILGYTNYSIGYMVEADEYGKNYESMASLLRKYDSEYYCEFITGKLTS